MPVVLVQEQNGTPLVQNSRGVPSIFEAAVTFTDHTPPVVTAITTPPIYRQTTVVINVTDDKGLVLVELYLVNADGSVNWIYDGSKFVPPFEKSTVLAIANGFQFQLNRRGGWLSQPTFKVRAIDQGLNEA